MLNMGWIYAGVRLPKIGGSTRGWFQQHDEVAAGRAYGSANPAASLAYDRWTETGCRPAIIHRATSAQSSLAVDGGGYAVVA